MYYGLWHPFLWIRVYCFFFFFQAEDGIRYGTVTGVQTCALPIRGSEVTGSVLRKPGSSGNWSWDGGTAITVAAGETVDTIARRHGVPASVIMQANNITAPATLYPGQRLVIPHYKSSRVATAPTPRPAVPTPAPAASPPGNGAFTWSPPATR